MCSTPKELDPGKSDFLWGAPGVKQGQQMLGMNFDSNRSAAASSGGSSPSMSFGAPSLPSFGQSAKSVYKAMLKYGPKLSKMEWESMLKYLPKQSQLALDLNAEYMPQQYAQEIGQLGEEFISTRNFRQSQNFFFLN